MAFLNSPLFKLLLTIISIAFTFTIVSALILTILYLPSFLQKKVNLKKSEQIMQDNIEIVERAIFFETSTKLQEFIDDQMNQIRKNAAKLKSLRAESDQREKDIANMEGKGKSDN